MTPGGLTAPIRRALGACGLCALVLAPGATDRLEAQDAHYWSQQYGTHSELLGGTVVGSPQDLSTTYYNPGGLAFLENQTFLLSAAAIEYEQYSLRTPSLPDVALRSRRLGAAPALFTGTFPRSWIRGRLAYSYLVRQKLDFRIDEWLPAEATDPVGNLLLDNQVRESWGGLTWATPLGPVGVGVSLYGAYRSHRNRSEILSQPIEPTDPSSNVATVDDYDYWALRALAKVGLHWRGDRLSLGLTVTTPGLQVASGGSASYLRAMPDTSGTGPPTRSALDVVDPDVDYRSPLSIAVGARYPVGRGALYLTSEWFSGKARYAVLSAPELEGDDEAASLRALLTEDLDAVLNVGLGGEYSPADRLTFFGSVISDRSAASSDPEAAHSMATWNSVQLSLGAAFTALRSDFTLGLSYSGGEDSVPVTPSPNDPGAISSASISQRRWKVFVGFELLSAGS